MSNEPAGNLARTILGLGEERMGELINQLLANERFVNAMQSAVSSSLSAKKSVDQNLTRLFGIVNVPTLEDVDELREKLNELEDLLGDIHDRIRRLDERIEASKAEAPPPKKATRKKKGA